MAFFVCHERVESVIEPSQLLLIITARGGEAGLIQEVLIHWFF